MDHMIILNYDLITNLYKHYYCDYYSRFIILFNNYIYQQLHTIVYNSTNINKINNIDNINTDNNTTNNRNDVNTNINNDVNIDSIDNKL